MTNPTNQEPDSRSFDTTIENVLNSPEFISATAEERTRLSSSEERDQRITGTNNNLDTNLTSTTNANSSSRRSRGNTFNINRFRAEVTDSDGILPTHSFLVVFAPMNWVSGAAYGQDLSSILTMRCDNAILPSINLLQEQNIRRFGFGPVENVAYGVNVGDFSLQFIVDKKALVVDFFEAWLNRIVNRDSYGGANINETTAAGTIPGSQIRTPYEVAYKDTYSCSSVNVFIYDRAQNTVLEYNIYDVFPTGIQSMNMSWQEENTMMKLNITFSFTDLRIRPKVSAFGQSAPSGPPVTRAPSPIPTGVFPGGNIPLVTDVEASAAVTRLVGDTSNQPIIIGDSNNDSARTFATGTSTPIDILPTAAINAQIAPKVIRNAFGISENP